MRLTIKFLLIVQITLAALVMLEPTKTALACSGIIPLSIDEILDNTQYVVKATVLEADDLGQNYVLEVESYLMGGEGPKYILLTLNHTEMIEGILLDFYGGGDCNFLFPRLNVGESTYLFVYRQNDGSYASASGPSNPPFYPYYSLFSSSTNERVFEFFVTKGDDKELWQPTEQEFVDYIGERTGDTPTPPDSDSPYPMLAPLLLGTAAESLYLLPVDFGSPVKLEPDSQLYADYIVPRYRGSCASPNCHSTSPNGLFNATQMEADQITIGAFYGDPTFSRGQGFLFSSTSEAIAIWKNPSLEIRYIHYPGGGREYNMDLINTTELRVSSAHVFESFVGVAQWSPDGRFLAFTDADGLWLWDVYTENAEPRLLISVAENGDLPIADYFSPRGRYLAFSQGATQETLDTISGQHYPYGLISPNDRTLLAFDSLLSDNPVQVCSLAPYKCTEELPPLRQVAWQNSDRYIAVTCYSQPNCVLMITSTSRNARYFIRSESSGDMFAYDARLDLLAVLSEGYTVTINDTALDLTDSLDGYVLSMEWLPSMFYFVD